MSGLTLGESTTQYMPQTSGQPLKAFETGDRGPRVSGLRLDESTTQYLPQTNGQPLKAFETGDV